MALGDDAVVAKRSGRRRSEGLGRRFSFTLLGLAGLGVGVWLFRSRRARRKPG